MKVEEETGQNYESEYFEIIITSISSVKLTGSRTYQINEKRIKFQNIPKSLNMP